MDQVRKQFPKPKESWRRGPLNRSCGLRIQPLSLGNQYPNPFLLPSFYFFCYSLLLAKLNRKAANRDVAHTSRSASQDTDKRRGARTSRKYWQSSWRSSCPMVGFFSYHRSLYSLCIRLKNKPDREQWTWWDGMSVDGVPVGCLLALLEGIATEAPVPHRAQFECHW